MFTSSPRKNHHRKRLWVAIAALSPLAVQAEIEGQISAPRTLEELHVTAHRTDANLRDVPASISVISREQIAALQANTLGQLLRYETGVEVDRTSDRHGDANITIRGIGGNRIIMLRDGARMPDGFGSAGSDQGRGNFNARNLERVEILKGPASALYGSDALGGVVLLQSLDPERLVKAEGNNHVEVSSGYHSTDERVRGELIAASELGNGYGLLQLEQQRYNERDINSAFEANPQDGETSSLLAKWVMDTSESSHWEFVGEFWRDNRDTNLLTNLGPISGPPGSAITDSSAEDESTRWHLGVHQVLEKFAGFDQLHWQVDYHQSRYEQHEYETTTSFFSDTLDFEHEKFDQNQWSFNVQGQKQWGNHTLVMGVEGLQKELERPVDRTFTNLRDNAQSKTANGVTYPGKSFPDTDITQYGLFAQDKLSLSDNLNLVLGIRYDYFRSEPTVDTAYNNFNPSGTEPETRSDSHWSPHAGITYELNSETQLYANVTTGFRAPPVDDQFISRAILIPVPGVPHEVIPNNDLDSETSKGYELGLRWQGQLTRVNFAYYKNRYSDFIDSRTVGYRDQAPVFVGPTSIRQIQYQNVDSVEIEGWELGGSVVADNWMPTGWQGQFNFAMHQIEGENRETGNGLNSVGPDKVVLGFSLNRNDGRFGAGWHLTAAAEADEAEPLSYRGQSLPAFEPPGYTIHDLNLFWQVSEALRLDLAVYNLLDKKYWSAHNKGANAAGDLDARVASGRNFGLNASYQF